MNFFSRLHIEPIIKAYEEHGYRGFELRQVATEIELSNRDSLLTVKKRNLTPNPTPVCVRPFNQHNIDLIARSTILRYWHFLKNSPTVRHLFQHTPTFGSYIRRNFRSILCR